MPLASDHRLLETEADLVAHFLLGRIDDLRFLHDPREITQPSVDLPQAPLSVNVVGIFGAVAERCGP